MTVRTDSGIYIITNAISGKVYIGSTIDFDGRWNRHRNDLQHNCHHNKHLQRAWDRYGFNAFEFGILEYLDNLDELVKAEQFWMDIYREEGKELYNYGECADNALRGVPMSEEHKRRIGDANRGNRFSEEIRRRMSDARRGENNPNYGIPMSEEQKCKISDTLMGHSVSKETRQRISEANTGRPSSYGMLGKKHTVETRQRMSESALLRYITNPVSEETRYRMSEAAMGRKFSEEHRRRLSESAKCRWAKYRARQSQIDDLVSALRLTVGNGRNM